MGDNKGNDNSQNEVGKMDDTKGNDNNNKNVKNMNDTKGKENIPEKINSSRSKPSIDTGKEGGSKDQSKSSSHSTSKGSSCKVLMKRAINGVQSMSMLSMRSIQSKRSVLQDNCSIYIICFIIMLFLITPIFVNFYKNYSSKPCPQSSALCGDVCALSIAMVLY